MINVTDDSGLPAYHGTRLLHIVSEVVMQKNMGGIDRGIRIVIGLALLGWTAFGTGDVRLWGLIGIPLVLTAAIGWCPAYLPFGIKTCGPK